MERDKLLQLLTPVTLLRVSLGRPWGLFFPHCGPRSFPAAVGWEGLPSGKESRWEGKESARAVAPSGMERQRLCDNVPLSLYVDGTASH